MTPLKWIVNEAKKLKKQYPHRFKKWTDYVAQASAIYASKHKGKSPVGKKHKVSGITKKAAKKKVVKKSVLRKKAVKKSPARMLHKDTKSHNVNIRVMSGVKGSLEHLNNLIKEKFSALGTLDGLKINLKNTKDKAEIRYLNHWISKYKKFVLGLNKQIKEAKKHI
jgi:hypothetical protein